MAKKPIVATKIAAWFCEDGHLHFSLTDANDNEVAKIHLCFEDGVDVVMDLLDELEETAGPEDAIGPTVGNA